MTEKKRIGELISLSFSDRKNPVSGIVIDYNDEWTLMKQNPVDYVIDGYIIVRHKNIEGFSKGANEKFKEKLIRLKGIKVGKKDLIPLTDMAAILGYLTEKFGVFQLETKSETACYLGALKSIDSKHLAIRSLDTKGKWRGTMKFRLNDIRIIAFNTDYINSLKLVSL